MPLIGLCVFFISLIGYKSICEILKCSRHLSWITGMIIQTLLLYIFAMTGPLITGIKFVTTIGCLLFTVCLFLKLKDRNPVKYEGKHSYDIWMFAISMLFLIALSKSPLIHYDNYSNWAVIVKFMIFQGHLPTNNALVTFTSYPPAAGLYITQFVYLVGFSNSAMLIGQFFLIWASLYAIFSVLRDKTRALNGGVLCFAIALTCIFNISIRTNNLLVDYLLPVVTAAGFAGVYVYRRQATLQVMHVILFCSMLLLIKSSGIFFVILIFLFYFYWLFKIHTQNKVKYFCIGISSIVVSLTPFAWWQYHVKTTFNSIANHAISTVAYKQQLSGESKNYLYQVGGKIVSHFFNINTLSTQGFILINIFLIVSWSIIRFKVNKPNNLFKVLICLDLIFIAYYASLFGTYTLSMTRSEAAVLNGFERYMSSIVNLDILLGSMVFVVTLDHSFYEQQIEKRSIYSFSSFPMKNMYQVSTFVVFVFSTILMLSEINGISYTSIINEKALPVQLEKLSSQDTNYTHKKVLLVDPTKSDISDNYAYYVGRYYYFSDHVVAREAFMMSPKRFEKLVRGYEYVVISKYHRTFSIMIKKVYRQKIVKGIYRVTKKGLVKVNRM